MHGMALAHPCVVAVPFDPLGPLCAHCTCHVSLQVSQVTAAQLQQLVQQLQSAHTRIAEAAAAATALEREQEAVICMLQQQGKEQQEQLSASTSELAAARNTLAELDQQLHQVVKDAAAADAMAHKLANDMKMVQNSNASCQAELQQQLAAVNLQLSAEKQHSKHLEEKLEQADGNMDLLAKQLQEAKASELTVELQRHCILSNH